jgi:hypothetical protein
MNQRDSWGTRARNRLGQVLQTKRLAIFSGASLVVALTLLWVASRIYFDSKRVDPGDVLPAVASIDAFAALLDTIGDDRELVDILHRRSVRLEAARRNLGSERAASGKMRRQLGAVLDSTLADLTNVEGSLAIRKSTKLAALSQLHTQIGLLRDKVSEARPSGSLRGEWLEGLLHVLLWPVIAGVLLVYLFASNKAPDRIADLLTPFTSVELFGAKLLLNEQTGRRAERAFKVFRAQVNDKFDFQAERNGLAEKVRSVIFHDVMEFLKTEIKKEVTLRCTLHVPDLLFSEHLYQLLDYYPDYPGAEKRGRIKPIYFGLIGKVWRSGSSEVRGEVPTIPDLLVDQWGMTQDQAKVAGKGRKSFVAVLLKDKAMKQIGIFYMDSEQDWAFSKGGDDKTILDLVLKACNDRGLTDSLSRLTDSLSGQALSIKLYG